MTNRETTDVLHRVAERVSRRLERYGVDAHCSHDITMDVIARICKTRSSILSRGCRSLEAYVDVAARNRVISEARRRVVVSRYREAVIHLSSPGVDTARYDELLLQFVEWRTAEGLPDLERRFRRIFCECSTYSEFGRKAGLDRRVAAPKYARLRDSFCASLGIEESLFIAYTRGTKRKRAG